MKVAIYVRESDTRKYKPASPRAMYPADVTFCLRYTLGGIEQVEEALAKGNMTTSELAEVLKTQEYSHYAPIRALRKAGKIRIAGKQKRKRWCCVHMGSGWGATLLMTVAGLF